MGWGGGTEIFDAVADELLEYNAQLTGGTDYISHFGVIKPLKNLYKVLCKKDWDNACESKYWDHPVIGKILGNTFESDEQE